MRHVSLHNTIDTPSHALHYSSARHRTTRQWSSDFGDELGGRNWVSLDKQLETEIGWTQRYTLKPWSSEFGDALVAGCDRASLEQYLDMVDLEAVNMEEVDGGHARCWDSIHRLVNSKPWECDEVTLTLKIVWKTGWWWSIDREARRNLKPHSVVNSKLCE